ncbi:platelet-activating factor acetylhydrolase isoform II [Ureibacillus xyleni]|uniref:Platelet-activating factor acetylhydrolase isoform II n=1 Tax=Ureibacillus xyleni TaxID=614648 RepID=A0A285SQP7_9BACL|nr:hypothetical protein [Ureibacillus xyleni]SOC08555.1 platelet-activating factor acetylhydrolase isoform II [Ureibacillus xyleni]
MRILELSYISAITLIAISLFIIPKENKKVIYKIFVFIVALAFIQIFFEGFRWQMVPSYLLGVFIIFLISKRNLLIRKRSSHFYVSFLVCWIPLSILLPILLPIFQLPKPTGNFETGVVHESLSGETMKIWYPTLASGEEKASYLSFKEIKDLSPFFQSHLEKVKANSVFGTPVASNNDGFPVIILSHDLSDSYFTGIGEELASHGFIVVVTENQDTKQIVEYLSSLNGKSPFHLDLQNIGVIAHSIANYPTLFHRANIKSGVSINSDKSGKPLLTFHMGNHEEYFATIDGATHMNFTDVYFYSPYLSIRDKVNPKKELKLTSKLLLQYFKSTLTNDISETFLDERITIIRK